MVFHNNRHFYRCIDCLTVMAAEAREIDPRCGLCTGQVEYLGRVEGPSQWLKKTSHECPCDHRCTAARGPKCDCSCGGINHGSNLMVLVTRIVGEAPVLNPPTNAKALAVAKEWRTAQAQLLAAIDQLLARKSRERLSDSDFWRLVNMQKAVRSARKARTHAGRMKTAQRHVNTTAAAVALQSALF